jgi:RNA polymerase sigma-70 factor (ECF subfamily)
MNKESTPPDSGRSLDSEAVLARRLRALEPDAWTQLFDEHRDQIWRYALVRTGNSSDADEVTSQVFVEALDSIKRYRYTGKPVLAWLYRIARNHAGKVTRQRRRSAPLSDAAESAAPVEGAIDSLVIWEALRTITEEQSEVIALRFFAGYSTTEIAQAMGKTEAAVYSLEVRAIAALRRRLAVESEDFRARPDKFWASQGIDK